jgi:lambda family phage tail tape measure protein
MATSVKVTLELDDRGYLTGIKAATDETNKLKGAAERGTQGIATGFTNATGKLNDFAGKMNNLVTVLLGAGFVAFGQRALAAADNVVDLSNATDVSIPKILQLRDAFAANGGSADGLAKVLSKLSNSLYDAREGGATAQENLIKLGFSMKEIANLNTDQAMGKVVEKLAGMTDPVERNALAFRTLGKEAKSIDWVGIANGTKNATDEYDKMAASQKAAADAHDKLNAAADKLTIAFASMLDKVGVLDFIKNLDTNMQKVEKVVTVAAGAMAAFAGASVIAGLVAMVKVVLDLEKGIIALGIALKLLEQGNIFTRLASLAFTIGAAAGAYLGVTKLLEEAMKGPDTTEAEKALEAQRKAAEAAAAANKNKPAVTPYWEKELVGIRQLTAEYGRNEQALLGRLRASTAMLGDGEDQIAKTTRLNEVTARFNDKMAELKNKQQSLQATPQSAGRDAQIAEITKQMKAVDALYESTYERAVADTTANNNAISLEKIRVTLLNDQIALQDRLKTLQDESAKVGLTGIEKKYYDIEAAAKKAAEAEIRAEEQRRFGAVAGQGQYVLGADEKKRITEAAAERAKAEKAQTQSTYEAQRTFAGGWKDAFNSYVESATNAAQQAQSIFSSVTKGLEDLIVNFVTTGKLNFKDFANSIIAEFVRIQARKVIANIMGGSGTSDFFSMLTGRASGGPVAANTPYIVGENGPELFYSKTAGNIIPNNKLGSIVNQGNPISTEAMNNIVNVNYTIHAADAQSFRQMIARDPEFLYAVTEKGRSSIPSGRR